MKILACLNAGPMKFSDFTSEYDLADLPTISGPPLTNADLDSLVGAISPESRVDQALANMLWGAVYLYYFAKRAHPRLAVMAAERSVLRSAIRVVDTSLVKQAVIGIASTIDLTTGRTSSLPHALDALEAELNIRLSKAFDTETAAAVELIQHIRGETNADTVLSLKYVRYFRNKWAGHSSLDRSVDSWAGADTTLNFSLLEDALVRMVNAFQNLGTLAPMSRELRDIEARGHAAEVQSDGTQRVRMAISWNGAAAMALVMREAAQKAAEAFLDQLA
ncbi:hypothetical protein HRD49_14715 [Corallococcus exiguus]|uniref:hypothetical protein n=1 Tax=Corallococcus exiguus TaxID=83462 RepID=UPI0010E43A54|nr:hypothetical protein [Corallococcus exiguus]NRD62999.1 hypothetical protein [Corallococcus exiguus]RYZ34985.1 MAG: hypothetical protein EOO71_37230 [Myxococcaceae bacterium]